MAEKISRMYQLYELKDEIPQGIENAQKLLTLEEEFIALIKDSGKYDKFSFMLKDLENEMEGLKDQIKRLNERKAKVTELLDMYEKKDDTSILIDNIVTLLFEAIGAIDTAAEEGKNIPDPEQAN